MVTIDINFIRRYVQSSDSVTLRDISGGSTVVKVPEFGVAIKFGSGVTQGEAFAQATAFALLDPALVCIPKVHHFHRDSHANIGYLAMEWIDGSPIDLQDSAQVEALQKSIHHLASFRRHFPGPLHAGEPQGILWEDSAPGDYHTVEGLEEWVNKWQHTCVDFCGEEFVLCHLDTAAENMLWLPSGQTCLLDWASAGIIRAISSWLLT
jgi:Phosphotransferase enzyme family